MIEETDFIKKGGRKLYAYVCDYEECGDKFYRRKDHIELNLRNGHKSFCSSKCKNKNQENWFMTECNHCGKHTKKNPGHVKKSKYLYCNNSCAAKSSNKVTKAGKKHHNYKGGHASYRAKALRHYEHKCHNPECLITPTLELIPVAMLDVDHIDSNRKNNDITNLMILCVWCHGLKSRNVEIHD